jgi:hypothetical protein
MLLCASTTLTRAQTSSTPEAANTTIHVYSNLLQLPVLILGPQRQTVSSIAPERFRVEIQNGPVIVPRHVRMEGDDPITLAILLDNAVHNELLEKLPEHLAELVPKSLHPNDRVAIYITDGCRLRRITPLVAAESAVLKERAENALKFTPFHGDRSECNGPRHLWDAMAYVDSTLVNEPGRRVLLAITNGDDSGSTNPPARLHEYATQSGVAMFAIAQPLFIAPLSSGRNYGPPPAGHAGTDLSRLTEGSGGLVLDASSRTMPGMLKHFVELLRGRYIVEFSRPTNMQSSSYVNITFGAPAGSYFVTSGGTSFPTNDPADAAKTPGSASSDGAPAAKP